MALSEWKKLSLSQNNISNLFAIVTNELTINEDRDNDNYGSEDLRSLNWIVCGMVDGQEAFSLISCRDHKSVI